MLWGAGTQLITGVRARGAAARGDEAEPEPAKLAVKA